MPKAAVADNELARLEALRHCDVLDTPPEPVFDDLTKLAAQLCNVPVALVSLVDSERQWFKSSVGLCILQTNRDSAFCAHAILSDEAMVVEDAAVDPRTFDNELVTGPPYVRFYAGVPLRTADGFALGTLCAIDFKSRTLSSEQISGLKSLARRVVILLEQRRSGHSGATRLRSEQTRHRICRSVVLIFVLGLLFTAMLAGKFDAAAAWQVSSIIALSGTMISTLLAALVWSLGFGKMRAIALANAITAELSLTTERAEKTAQELDVKSVAMAIQRDRLALALSGSGVGTWDWDVTTCEIQFDQHWRAIIGEEPQTQKFENWIKRIHPEDIPEAQAGLQMHLRGQAPIYETVHRLRHVDGSWRWTRTKGLVVSRDDHGRPARMVGISEDITSQKNVEEAAVSAAAILRRTGEIAKVGGWELDISTQILTWTDQVYRIHDVPIGVPITVAQAVSFYDPDARALIEGSIQVAMTTHSSWDLELPLITANGKRIWVRTHGEPIIANGIVVKLCGALQDITERKQTEEQLRRSATHDKLTGLPNRALLHDRLQQCILRRQRSLGRAFAVLFLDFDRFKIINDSLGHQAGDDLLKMIAGRLRESLRPSDSVAMNGSNSMASRLGGDEFVVILDEVASAEDVIVVADRLLSIFAEPYLLGQHKVVSSASIGIVTSDPDYLTADEMLRDADTAMYEAKAAGKGRYVVFDLEMRERVERLCRVENDLKDALSANQLFMVYQPILSLESGETVSVEALIRWKHPERGIIPPCEFIPLAEETGQIISIGEWVIREACSQFMKWRTTLGEAAPPSISVNLSRKQLAMTELPQIIKEILEECAMPPECLHFEVTETAVMKDTVASARILHAIKDVGVKLAMDDFGTGHSSLACLHQFPIDLLKIDQSFIKNIERGRDFAALVQAIVQLARNLDIQVVAEGIETSDQAYFLGSLDCAFGQGMLFSGPMLPEEIGSFMISPHTLQKMASTAHGNAEAAA